MLDHAKTSLFGVLDVYSCRVNAARHMQHHNFLAEWVKTVDCLRLAPSDLTGALASMDQLFPPLAFFVRGCAFSPAAAGGALHWASHGFHPSRIPRKKDATWRRCRSQSVAWLTNRVGEGKCPCRPSAAASVGRVCVRVFAIAVNSETAATTSIKRGHPKKRHHPSIRRCSMVCL